MRLLVVEDDRKLSSVLQQGLSEEGHSVVLCTNGADGLDQARKSAFDVVILDVMLPVIDGFDVARRLRRDKIPVPILMLTGRDATSDIIKGLDAGADDYLTKPFSFEVLLARLRALARRTSAAPSTRLAAADLVLDLEAREVRRGGALIPLTKTEFSVLECLLRRAGRPVPRQTLIDEVWGFERDVENNTLDVFIRMLRTKVDEGHETRLIHTVRGIGYCVREGEPA
jgi:DNA-binding response OmpR family regulator